MKTNSRVSRFVLAGAIVAIAVAQPTPVLAQTAAERSSGANNSVQWSVQVDKVDPGNANLEASFQIAIYENLLTELSKTKRFRQVFRDGDRNALDTSDLIILKTIVQKYSPGNETRRAVTTVSGATKLTVRSQLCTTNGAIILDHAVNGNVRFMGSNLRATHNLARNVAKTIKGLSFPEPSLSVPAQSGEL